jgi:AcrR family transcriptional regulator
MTDIKRRVTKPASERRREIVDAAIKLFAERGYQETTVQDIAVAADVATGSVYIHFASKDALLHAVNERFYEGLMERMSDVVTELLARLNEGKPVTHIDAVDLLIDATAAHVQANAVLCEVTAKYVAHSDLVRAELPFVEFLAATAQQAAEAGVIHAPDPEMLAYLTHAAVSSTMMTSIAYGKPADFDRLVAATKYMLYRTFAPPDATS